MLSILRKARLKDKEMRILMLGLDNAGKTTIVKKIMGEDVNTVSPTLGFIIKTIDYDGCIDLGGRCNRSTQDGRLSRGASRSAPRRASGWSKSTDLRQQDRRRRLYGREGDHDCEHRRRNV